MSFNITMRRPAGGNALDESTYDLNIQPGLLQHHLRQITAGSTDFQSENQFNQHIDFDAQFNHFANRHGSGWTLVAINSVEVTFVKTRVRQAAGAYFVPPDVGYSCLNIDNGNDRKCFMWSILASICAPRPQSQAPTTDELERYIDRYNWSGIDWPADYETACDIFEENNHGVALHVWRRLPSEEGMDKGKWESYPVRVSPRVNETNSVKQIDIYYAVEDLEDGTENAHYLLIQHLNSFLYWGKGKQDAVCRVCVKQFKYMANYVKHLPTCNQPQKISQSPNTPEDSHPSWRRSAETLMPYYVALHVDTHTVDNVMKISKLSYIVHGSKGIWEFAESHVEHLLSQLGHADWVVVVKDAKVLHLLIAGLPRDFKFADRQIGGVEEGGMLCMKIGRMRFIDTSRFYPSTATSALQLHEEWERFRSFAHTNYGLDPLHYWTLSMLAWDAALKHIGDDEAPEHFRSMKIHDIFRKGIRGAVNVMPQRKAEAGDGLYLANFDINSAYGYSMKQHLPQWGYEMIPEEKLSRTTPHDIQCMDDEYGIGYVFVVDLECPDDHKWQDRHSELPLAPDHRNGKLVCSFEPKREYVVHYRLLKFYLSEGMKLTKIHAGISFKQGTWLKSFMEKQEKLRNEADPMMNKVIKLMTNSVFGKSCFNPFKNSKMTYMCNLDTLEGRKRFAQYGSDHLATVALRGLSENVIACTQQQTNITVSQHVAVGFTILELGKLQLYQWWYDRLRLKCSSIKLMYCDTDSFIVTMREDPKLFVQKHKDWFNSKVGSLKDEDGDERGVLFIGCKPKHYLYETDESMRVRIAGMNREASASVTAQAFTDALDNQAQPVATVPITRIRNHEITIEERERHYLNDKDTSRHYISQYDSVPFGHYLHCNHAWVEFNDKFECAWCRGVKEKDE